MINKKKLLFIGGGVAVTIVAVFLFNQFGSTVTVDGLKIRDRTLVGVASFAGLIPKKLEILENLSTASADYITYDKDRKTYTCANNKQEALDLLYNNLKNLNIPQAEKDQVKNYDFSKIKEENRFFKFVIKPSYGSMIEKTLGQTSRVHKCSYLQLANLTEASYSLQYNERPITKEGVKKLSYYIWALWHFGFPHYVAEKAYEDDNNFYHVIYFVEPHTFEGSDLGGCDFVELVKRTIGVNKKSGAVSNLLDYPQIFVKTGTCHEPAGI